MLPLHSPCAAGKSTDGEVANALVCKTSIRGFNSLSVLQQIPLTKTFQNSSRANSAISHARFYAAPGSIFYMQHLTTYF